MKIKGGQVITPRDIQLITGCSSYNSAQKEHLAIRTALGKSTKRLTIREYCEYWEMDYNETATFLNDNR